MNADKSSGRPDKSDPKEAELKARLAKLDARLERFEETRAKDKPESARQTADVTQMGRMFRYIGDFVSGVIAGALLGWVIDRYAGTSPWGLIICLLLGFCAGVWNLVRSAERDRLGKG